MYRKRFTSIFFLNFIVLSLVSYTAFGGDTRKLTLHEHLLERLKENRGVIAAKLDGVGERYPTYNPEAVIPPMCYTKHEGKHNPCYVCHQNPRPERENFMADGDLQLEYSFSDEGTRNHYKNLFEDRTERVAAISDEEIDAWVNQDNYSSLAQRLGEAGFKAWIPDLKNLHLGPAAFDEQGFALDGSHWVAFNYKPLPSTFWPTNGNTDDVMIRLPEAFRTNQEGIYSHDIYKANLAIAEAMVKGFSEITTLAVDENAIGKDLDGDGKLGIASEIRVLDSYVGAAEKEHIDTYLYPKGTEFLHTVRYVGFSESGEIEVSTRMKEVRYMKKWRARHKMDYKRRYQLEDYHKDEGRLPFFQSIGDWGLDNDFFWSVQGFIEGRDGELRTATYEENLFCMGCHSTIGSTIDKTFSFPRKVDGAEGWGYINLKDMPDAPNMGELKGEIATYLERVGGGGEFRSNPEMFERWFKPDGSVDMEKVSAAKDVYTLITPSVQRARLLNKAYRTIVEDQDYIYGRDATVTPPVNVHENVDNVATITLPLKFFRDWDIRLDWKDKKYAAEPVLQSATVTH